MGIQQLITWFLYPVYNGKLKLIMSNYDYIYKYYDSFLSLKSIDEKTCKAHNSKTILNIKLN